MSALKVTWASDIEPEPAPWPHFPHCPNPRCRRRLWAANGQRRADNPRGPLIWPTRDGRCPHCNADLRWDREAFLVVERERAWADVWAGMWRGFGWDDDNGGAR